jgi:hypothetical protein
MMPVMSNAHLLSQCGAELDPGLAPGHKDRAVHRWGFKRGFWNLLTHQTALTLKRSDGSGGLFGFTFDSNLTVSSDTRGALTCLPAAPACEIPKTKTAHRGVHQ